jgi:hypothetical protein
MNNKSLIILGLAAATLIIIAAIMSGVADKSQPLSDSPSYLIQGLDPADIDTIIIGTGDNTVTLKRQGRGFVIANKDNYPAGAEHINGLLSQCLEVQISELYTDNPANHADLGVTEDKPTSIVRFFRNDPNSSLMTGLIVGKYRETSEGMFIRLLPGDKVYVASRAPYIPGQADAYIDKDLISTQKDQIESVTVKTPDGEYTLKKDKDSQKTILENIPAGKKLKDADPENVFSAMAPLRCDDVQKSTEGLTFDRQFICRLKDSTVYTVDIAQKGGDTFVQCKAQYTGEVPTKGTEAEPEEVLKQKEAKLLALDKANKLAARHQGWVYKIAQWKAKYLTQKLDDLLEDEKPAEPIKQAEQKQPQEPNAVKAEQPIAPAIEQPKPVMPADPNSIKKVQEPNAVKVEQPKPMAPSDSNAVSEPQDPNTTKPIQ